MERRDFLKHSALAVAAASAVCLPKTVQAGEEAENTSTENTSTETESERFDSETVDQDSLKQFAGVQAIDVHHHMVPEFYVERLEGIGITTSLGVPFPEWSPEASIEIMNQASIQTAVLSLSSPGVYFGDRDFAVQLARDVNEYAAATVADYPGRFGFFATLPTPLVDESIAEVIYALDVLQADGVCLLSASGDVFLGDPGLEDLMTELNNREAVVYMHPHSHSSIEDTGLTTPHFAVEAPIDTTRAVTNLITMGVFERYPKIKWILSHAGGTIPYLAWRLSLLDLMELGYDEGLEKGTIIRQLKNLYYDTALSPWGTTMAACLQLLDSRQIVFGSDYPFAPAELVLKERADLALNIFNFTIPLFTEHTYNQILVNALSLIPALAE